MAAPAAKLGVDPVNHGLLRHPPEPEPNRRIGRVPGPPGVSWIPRGEFGDELPVGSVEQRHRLFIPEPGGRPLRLRRAPRRMHSTLCR